MRHALYPAAYKVIIAGVLVGVIGIAFITGASRVGGDVANEGTQGVLECFSASLRGGDVTHGVSLASTWRDQYNHEVLDGFEREVMSVSALYPLVSSDGLTVGFTHSGSSKEAASFVREQVERNGWVCIESGNSSFFTFIKETGTFHWLGVTCVEEGRGTSVVMVVQEGGSADGA